jgi:hypothetical protein
VTITLSELFSTSSDADGAAKFDSYKTLLKAAHTETSSGDIAFDMSSKTITKGLGNRRRALERLEVIEKAWGADNGAADLSAEIQNMRTYLQADIQKDWTPSNPVGGTGLTPYDLEAPAKVLVPRYTPLRNSVPRTKGQGNARKFKRIDSFSNAGISGGAANLSPFFASATETSTWGGPGNLTLNRPQKISYTGSDHSVGYVELGLSDQVNWLAQFEGLGFDDLRSLSHTALLYSHLMGEERAMLYGRGSGTGYEGAVSAPSGITTGTATSGGTLAAATYYVYVAAVTGFGQSAVSTVVSQVTTGSASTVTVTIGTEPTGALYYNLYVGTTTGIANATLQTSFTGDTYTFTSYSVTATTTTGTDTSASATSYDGFLTVQSDPANGGYFRRLNGAFSSVLPGSEIDTALTTMFVANGADPDEIYMTGAVRASYNQLMRNGAGSGGAASGYRTNVTTGDGNAVMGTVVGGHMNPNTGKVVTVKTHRFMPAGAVLIRSTSLPLPDAHIPAPTQAVNVQDYMAVDWPTIQMSYDTSTYQIGTLVHYAPAWNGLILGVQYSSTDGV